MVKLLLTSGLSLSQKDALGMAAVDVAAQYSPDIVLNALLERTNIDPQRRNTSLRTILHLAAMGPAAHNIPILVRHGCDVNALDIKLFSPLMLACRHRRHETMRRLLVAGFVEDILSFRPTFPQG
jgi:ankyrin repeat protein